MDRGRRFYRDRGADRSAHRTRDAHPTGRGPIRRLSGAGGCCRGSPVAAPPRSRAARATARPGTRTGPARTRGAAPGHGSPGPASAASPRSTPWAARRPRRDGPAPRRRGGHRPRPAGDPAATAGRPGSAPGRAVAAIRRSSSAESAGMRSIARTTAGVFGPVARLVDRRGPAAGQPLANPLAEVAGQVLVEERGEDDLLAVADGRVANPGVPADGARQPLVDASLDRLDAGEQLRRQEPGDRGDEGDRRRLGEAQPVDLGRRQPLDAFEVSGQGLLGVGGPASERRRSRRRPCRGDCRRPAASRRRRGRRRGRLRRGGRSRGPSGRAARGRTGRGGRGRTASRGRR